MWSSELSIAYGLSGVNAVRVSFQEIYSGSIYPMYTKINSHLWGGEEKRIYLCDLVSCPRKYGGDIALDIRRRGERNLSKTKNEK